MPVPFTHAGRTIPAVVTDRALEDRAARDKAACCALPWRSILIVEGRDAASLLHAMLTQDIEAMALGEVRPACQLDRKGHLIADLWVRREEERFALDLQCDLLSSVRESLERHLIAEDVRLHAAEGLSVVLLLGPETPWIVGELGLDAWPVHETAGSEFHLVTDDSPALISRLCGAGAREIGGMTLNRLRIEGGRPWWGKEFDRKNFPTEIGLEEALSFSKGCYVGQETIARLRYRGGVKKSLYGVRIQGEPPEEGSVIEGAAGVLATLLSVAGPVGEGDSLGLTLLRTEDQTPGREVRIAGRSATLEPLPFREIGDG